MGLGSKDDGADGAHALPGHGGDASVMSPRTYRREVLGHTEEELGNTIPGLSEFL